MAVTVRNYDLTPFWTSAEVIDIFRQALADVGYLAAAQTGTILTFTNTAGTTLASQRGKRYLVSQSATSGSGVYAAFDVLRSSTGAISAITLVRGGKNYAASNTITIAGADIGGATPTDNVTVTVSTVTGSQGSATTWYDTDSSTWGVACVNNNEVKRLGQTYYAFHMPANPSVSPTLYIRAGSGFNPSADTFMGVAGIDYQTSNAPNSTTQQFYSQVIASSNALAPRLTTYQSGVDPNFVVFQFSETTNYGRMYRNPFFLSKYESASQPWSLDQCFTAGVYEINKTDVFNTYDASVDTRIPTAVMGKRQGEWGYGVLQGTYANGGFLIGYYESMWGKKLNSGTTRPNMVYNTIYQRTIMDGSTTSIEYNPVVTGIPVCNIMVPSPYTIPADFGVTEVIATDSIGYADEISVGATTKWKVLQYANNTGAPGYNSAMAFVAKTVN